MEARASGWRQKPGSKTEAAGAVVAQERTGRLLGVVEETVYYRCVGDYSQRQGGLAE